LILHAIVKGRVQGVGFRYWLLGEARRIGVRGWVRNLPDGRVEVEAEGDEDQLFELEQRLWKGPVLSRVDNADCRYVEGSRDFTNFVITH